MSKFKERLLLSEVLIKTRLFSFFRTDKLTIECCARVFEAVKRAPLSTRFLGARDTPQDFLCSLFIPE